MVKTIMASKKVFFYFTAALLCLTLLSACSATPTVKSTADANGPSSASSAQAAFETALRAYENENFKPLEDLLPARFIGRSLLLDAARTARNEQKQIRTTLTEIRIASGPPGSNIQALSARWEKRFLKLPGLAPTVESGSLQAVMHQEAGQWLLDSLSADNPYTK